MSKRIPMMARGRRNRFFDSDGMDDLVAMIIELTSEMSVIKERQYVTEKILEEQGLNVAESIEQWQPSEEQEAEMATERTRLLGTVLRTLDVDSRGYGEHSLNMVRPQSNQEANLDHSEQNGAMSA